MEKDDNGFSASWNWQPDGQGQHPYTYNWFTMLSGQFEQVTPTQVEVEYEIAMMNLMDYLVDQMTSFPDVEEMLEKICK